MDRRILILIGYVLVAVSYTLAPVATATHSVPATATWWDVDNDGVVDVADGDPYYRRVGLSGTAGRKAPRA